jgi:ABC-type transporter Mla subunit MlaD
MSEFSDIELKHQIRGLKNKIDSLNDTMTSFTNEMDLDETNTLLTAIGGYTDGLEALIGTLNGLLNTLEASLTSLESKIDTIDTVLDAVKAQTDKFDFKVVTP